ncbi:MAG TPA: methyltransferase [Halioglobus sp.]
MARPPSTRKRFHRSSQKQRPPNLWGKDVLVVERMSQEGRGVAKRAGKIVFISGALAGEQVRVQCTAVKKDFDEAEMIELDADSTPSPQRVQPECPVFDDCGGCSLQHWALAAQQQHKETNLLSMLRAVAPDLELDPPITSPPRNFRHRLRLMVTRNSDKSYSLGLRQRRSHDAISLQHCMVSNPAVNALLQDLPGLLTRAPDLQGLREIEIDADSNNQLGLCFYFAAHPGERMLAGLRTLILSGPVIALRVRLNTQRQSRTDTPYDEHSSTHRSPWQELFAEGELCLRLAVPLDQGGNLQDELRLHYLPGDFTQTHWEVNAALVARALDWLRPGSDENALDLFCGIGNFSLPLARRTKSVVALEGDRTMALRVSSNAQRNGMANIRAKTLNLLADEIELPAAEIAIVDPPRAGAQAACEALARSTVRRLVYVSCHPATLARDARILQRGGLCLSRAAAVDMFPHTGHSEAIALFTRK